MAEANRSCPTAPRWLIGCGLVAVVVGVVARLVVSSPLWLDEALTVAIADLGPSGWSDALARDGHPPAHYALLWGWMGVFGDGDVAVRSLSTLLSLLALPLVHVAARRRGGPRAGWTAVILVSLSPWAVRYGSETRMYALVFLLVLIGWLAADDVLADRVDGGARLVRLAVVAGATGALLWSHYWAAFLGAASAATLAVRWWRQPASRRASRDLLAALAVGLVLFVPWLPVLAEQLRDTGTPWGAPTRPAGVVVETLSGLGGTDAYAEGVVAGLAVVGLAVIGALLVSSSGSRLHLDLRTAPAVRAEVVVAVGTVALGAAVGWATGSVYVGRYAAVFLPFVFIAAAVGAARLPGSIGTVAVAVTVLASVPGVALNGVADRTQGGEIGAVLAAEVAEDDVVAFCPDQLGPSTLRGIDRAGRDADEVRAVGVPSLARPDRIDWRDYEARNASADAVAVAKAIHDLVDGRIWLVVRPGYRTYEGLCEGVAGELGRLRGDGVTVVPDRGDDVFEPAALLVHGPR